HRWEPITQGMAVEATVVFPTIPGTFAAFWLMPADVPQRWYPEIDIAEAVGTDVVNHIFWTDTGVEDKTVTVNDGQPHRYRVELDTTESRILVDGVLVNTGPAYPGVEWG